MTTIRSLRFLSSVLWLSGLLASILLASGCSIVPEPKADPTRYYVLTMPSNASQAGAGEINKGKPFLALRSVEVPAYLRARRNIAVRHGTSEIVYHEFSRWAETLDAGITRIVSERLIATNSVSGVELRPGRVKRDYDVSIRIIECEGAVSGAGASPVARFTAEYEITAPGGNTVTGIRKFTAPAADWDGKDSSSLAALLGQAASALADDIARNLPATPRSGAE
ncbi:putative lipoprotein YmbA [Ereboglobus sp. PH5-10]|uniref:PqiC family protein n=1 Tax=Ereboglobus sp. PH5-10 TaxID=2940629 RepID=UPI0024064BED|nr:ABC-type transport auxiliary lipoprotein family protein [Ereboglobus sp. PH5-10]MDF9826794.1 putative lipoprotein YmbA [Ereboglobus sp. PH5-10]